MTHSRLMKGLCTAVGWMVNRTVRKLSNSVLPPPNSTEPLISSHHPAYLSAISIKRDRLPFEKIGSAGEYVGGWH